MCGIAGLLVPGGTDEASLHRPPLAMARAIVHRGPDGEGCWVDAEASIALGHQRLAIIDLSDTEGLLVLMARAWLWTRPKMCVP